jgi:ribonuclease VapC
VIVDTSALVAIAENEEGWLALREALVSEAAYIPAPVIVEFNLVTSTNQNAPNESAQGLLRLALKRSVRIEPFSGEDAGLSIEAHRLYGRGNGRGGKLNMLDIMVYCMAKRLDRPILCTGRDFASTDASIHPASRGW